MTNNKNNNSESYKSEKENHFNHATEEIKKRDNQKKDFSTSNEKNNETIRKIKEILDGLRPYLNMDGGDVEFLKYEDKIVYVKLTGACQACLFSDETIKNGLYESIKAEVPEIEGVINTEI